MPTVYVAPGVDSVGTPASGDTLIVQGGGEPIDTNLNQSALAAGLAIVEVCSPYTSTFGAAGSPFQCQISTALKYRAGSGAMYYQAEGTGGDTCALIYHTGGGKLFLVAGGTATRCEQKSGDLDIASLFIVTTLRNSGGSFALHDDGSTDPATLEMLAPGGNGYTERGGTTFTIKAGSLTIDAGTNTIGTLTCGGGNTSIIECGTITTLVADGAIPNVSALQRALTITNCTVNMALPGASAFLDHALITFTNTPTRLFDDRS